MASAILHGSNSKEKDEVGLNPSEKIINTEVNY